jgi:hypothetical protein
MARQPGSQGASVAGFEHRGVVQPHARRLHDVDVPLRPQRHVNGEHRRAGVRGRIGFGVERLDVDVQARKEIGEAVDDAGLVERGDLDGIGNQRLVGR